MCVSFASDLFSCIEWVDTAIGTRGIILLQMSQETALHAWHHIELVNQIIGLLLRVIDDIRHSECDLEVKDR